jgi:hypothetical protein
MTLSSFLSQKIKNSTDAAAVGRQRKRICTADNEEMENAVYKLCLDTKLKNIPVCGPFLFEQARSFEQSFGVRELNVSVE